MESGYFNHYTHISESRWERREFLHRWWRLNAGDRRWTPPPFPLLRRALVARSDEHLLRQHLAPVYVEALPGRPRREGEAMRGVSLALMEEPVAAALVMADPRRDDGTAYLGLLACANDEESLDRLLSASQEQAWRLGCSRLIGPVGLSPHLHTGTLVDHFDLFPPLYTPYSPPYLPDVLQTSLEVIRTTRLYTLTVDAPTVAIPTVAGTDSAGLGQVQLVPLEPARLAGDFLPLLVAAPAASIEDSAGFPPPDALEARFLLDWWGYVPLVGWLALVQETPVGFVLLQPDLAGLMRWAKGGRPLWRRAWLAWRRTHPVKAGRVLAGGVLPAWRGRGIGSRLWAQTLAYAAGQGWQTLIIGPLEPESDAATFLTARGASAQQSYALYATEG